MKIISVVGARPNFIKIAPFIKELRKHKNIESILLHTGQHYDDRMNRAFFDSLGIPDADINLGIGSGTHAEQVGNTMIGFEKVLKKIKPDWVVVVGDVNATAACSITAKKEHIKVAHIEAGLRSGDMKMPEEINRLITDRLSDLLLTPDEISSENLLSEGISEDKIRMVGNIMIDTLEANRDKASELDINIILNSNLHNKYDNSLDFENEKFALMTIHRPSNVDSRNEFEGIIDFLINEVAIAIPIIWPIHPRTEKQLDAFGLWNKILSCKNMVLTFPLGYHELLRLNMSAKIMFTDSGGLQEECCVLGTPCLTLRWNTERPITLRENGGASVLVGNEIDLIRKEYKDILSSDCQPKRPPLWDGKTAGRCVEALLGLCPSFIR